MKKFVLAALLLIPTATFAQSVDILYTGDVYTPPFYRGGAPWSQESTIKLFALPQGLGNPEALIYKWRQGSTVLGEYSGVGQNTITYTDSIFSKPQIFSIEVLALDDTVLARNYISVTPSTPGLLVYEKHPLYGFLFNAEASPSYWITGAETTFAAFPLFFSTESRTNPLISYSWRSGGREDGAQSTVTYRLPENGTGQAAISVKATNPASIRQAATESFLVQFDNEN